MAQKKQVINYNILILPIVGGMNVGMRFWICNYK
jgi:hypothetical protein